MTALFSTLALAPPPQPVGLMRLRLIGQMQVFEPDGGSLLPHGRKTRAMLAMLALATPSPVLRSRLAESLWSRRPDDLARASLRQEIHRLLDALGSFGETLLSVSRDHIQIRASAAWIDVVEVMKATPSEPDSLGLMTGRLLEDLDGCDPVFDAWLAGERERLADHARAVAEVRLSETTEPEALIAAAQRLLLIDRAHEGGWRALMRAYAARGERGRAIEAYERCRSALADRRGATPSAETQRLLAELRRGNAGAAALAPPVAPVVRPAASRQESLPAGAPLHPPRIGVLPPEVREAAVAHTPRAETLAEEISAALTRFRGLAVISSASLARFAAETRDETAIRRAFSLDYLLDGSLQQQDGEVRNMLRLVDLRSGNQMIWARRFALDDGAGLEEVAAQVAAQVEPEILRAEAARGAQPRRQDGARALGLSGQALTLRALGMLFRLERPRFMVAADLLTQAIAREPEYAAPHAWFALWYLLLISQDWAEDRAAAVAHAASLAGRAMLLDPEDARGLAIAGQVRAVLDYRPEEAIALHERALSLNPNFAMGWNFAGVASLCLGDLAEAERRIRRYKVLSPLDPAAFFLDTALVDLALLRHDHAAAVSTGRQLSEMHPSLSAACKPYLASLGHLGRQDEASGVLQRLCAIEPGFSLARFCAVSPFRRAADMAHYREGLRLAGVPE